MTQSHCFVCKSYIKILYYILDSWAH